MPSTSHATIAWPCPSRPPTLRTNEVHVWCAALSYFHEEMVRGSLSPDEHARAARFHLQPDRRRFITSHGILRAILGRYLGVAPVAVRLEAGENGKPRLAIASSTLRFNLAHSGDLALVAVTSARDIGVDIELVRPLPDLESLSERFFSEHERSRLASLAPDERLRGFFECWTRREAYLKATGVGVGGLESLPTTLVGWTAHQLDPAPEYVGAVAVAGEAVVRSFRWSP